MYRQPRCDVSNDDEEDDDDDRRMWNAVIELDFFMVAKK
jgi:hypothetical protein